MFVCLGKSIWNQPYKYLKILKRFKGVISPDFSLYRKMPLCMQKWSTYQGRALAHWWSENSMGTGAGSHDFGNTYGARKRIFTPIQFKVNGMERDVSRRVYRREIFESKKQWICQK